MSDEQDEYEFGEWRSEPKRLAGTGRADGRCFWCGYRVPEENLNKFYYGSGCMSKAWNYYNPPKDEDEEW